MFSYSECSYGLEEDGAANQILVYPNPGKGIFHISLEANDREMLLEVIDIYGVIVHCEKVRSNPGSAQNITFDITGKLDGVYLLKLSNTDFQRLARIIKH
jgi:hypothetical protein